MKEEAPFYQDIIELAADMIYQTCLNGNFFFVNDYTSRVTGYSKETLLKTNIKDLIHPDYRHYTYELESCFTDNSEKEERYIEFPILSKSGDIIWIGQKTIPFEDPTGEKRKCFLAVAREITNQKKLELKHEYLSAVVQHTQNYVIISDKNDKIIWVNNGFTEIYGYTLEETIGLRPGDLLRPNDIENPIDQEIGDQMKIHKTYNGEILNRTKDGRDIWVSLSITPIVNEGETVRYINVGDDITPRKETEIRLTTINEALTNSETRLRELFEGTTDLIQSVDPDGNFLFVNTSWCKALGYSLEEIKKLNTFHVIHPNSMEHFKETFEHLLEKQLPVSFETSFITKLGKEIKVFGNAVANQVAEDFLEVRGIFHDITARINQEEVIKEQNKDILDSINYAKRIQNAVLPDEEELQAVSQNHFVLNLPKNIVSGDFYFCSKIEEGSKNELNAVSVGDCTGHGVPGAFMSLIANVYLRQAMIEGTINSPGEALDYLNDKIANLLNKSNEGTVLRDGVDLSLLIMDRKRHVLNYASAKRPIILIRNGQADIIKGDSFHVGYNDLSFQFTNRMMELEDGDCFYIFSDGITDQFGGPRNKKFQLSRLIDLLLDIHTQPFSEQRKIVLNTHIDWRGQNTQTDDICVLGFQYNT